MSQAPKAQWRTTAASTAAVAAALVLPSGAAFAATASDPSGLKAGGTSVGSGNQALLPLDLPADICGLAVTLVGSADAGCQGGAVVQSAPATASAANVGSASAAAGNSAASGNKVSAPVSAPVSVCGVSITIIGSARSSCEGGTEVVVKAAGPASRGGQANPNWPGNPGGPSGPTSPTSPTSTKSHRADDVGHETSSKHHKHYRHHEKHDAPDPRARDDANILTTSKTATPTSAVLASSVLPTTGANLAALLAGGAACVGLGGTGVVVARRRRG
jgi:LPXTG-motif cell wall-anchored protein